MTEDGWIRLLIREQIPPKKMMLCKNTRETGNENKIAIFKIFH